MNTSFSTMVDSIGLSYQRHVVLLILICYTILGWSQAAPTNEHSLEYAKAEKLLENYKLEEAKLIFDGLANQQIDHTIRLRSKLRLSHLYVLLKNKVAYNQELKEVYSEIEQNDLGSTFLEADYFYEKAKKVFKSREYGEVKDLCQKGLNIIELNNIDSTHFQSKLMLLLAKAWMFEYNYDKADSLYRKAIELQGVSTFKDDRLRAKIYLRIAENHRYQQEYDQYLEYITKAEAISKNKPDYIEIIGSCLKNKASHAYQTNQYNNSVEYYQKALDYYNGLEVNETVFKKTKIALLIGLSNVYRLKQDYEQALETAEYLVAYTKPKDGRLNLEHVQAYLEYAKIKDKGFGASPEIDSIYDFAIEFYKKEFGPNDPQYGYMISNYATYLAIHKRYEASLAFALKAQKTFMGGRSTFSSAHSVANANLLGFIYTKLKKFDKAKDITYRVNEYYRNKYDNKGTLVARSYGTLASLANATGKYKNAIEYVDKGQSALQIMDEQTNEYKNGDYALNINLLTYKITAYQALYNDTESLSHLEDLNKVCDSQIQLISESRRENAMSESNYSLSSKFYGSFSKSIETLFELYKKTSEKKYLDDIFLKFEKSKSQSLLENYRSDDIMELVGVPQEIIKEKEEKMAVIKDRQEALRELEKSEGDKKIKMQESLLELKHEYKSLLSSINESYPEYEQKLYSQDIDSLEVFQNSILMENELVLSFLSYQDALYCLAITRENAEIIKYDFKASIKSDMLDYCENLGKNVFVETQSQNLNQFLITNEIESLLKGKSKLRIIPDAELNYLPFETLQNQEGQFLVNEYNISYAYSLQLMRDMDRKRSTAKKNVLAFAPKYEENEQLSIDTTNEAVLAMLVRDGRYNLPGAIKEVEGIKEITGAKTFINEKATEENFHLHANKYKVLHFAMHSILNEQEPEGSQMLFYRTTNDGLNNGKLSIGELRKSKLNADLAVLSACNTGRGQIRKGEGLLSLSKAFNFAGVKSTIMSLWKVPDESSAFIMIEFYKNLKKGWDKDVALNLAKKSYLSNDQIPNAQKTPYHWAGFVVSGSIKPIYLSQEYSFDPLLTLGLILLLGMGLLLKIRNQKKLV